MAVGSGVGCSVGPGVDEGEALGKAHDGYSEGRMIIEPLKPVLACIPLCSDSDPTRRFLVGITMFSVGTFIVPDWSSRARFGTCVQHTNTSSVSWRQYEKPIDGLHVDVQTTRAVDSLLWVLTTAGHTSIATDSLSRDVAKHDGGSEGCNNGRYKCHGDISVGSNRTKDDALCADSTSIVLAVEGNV